MPVTTFSSAVHITPVVIRTFFRHWAKKIKQIKNGNGEERPQDDIFFDQAFHIVKSFIVLGTKNTIESLQAFTNTHIPAPPWAAVCPVLIPLKSCNEAADHLIDWFDLEELTKVVGGDRWWQVRGLDGIDAEWVAEEEDLSPDGDTFNTKDDKTLKEAEANIRRMERLESVMLYIHGGGYFWGSINTHRYQILHYANKFKGRAFAVNYRKAPQYPWPCPLQDVLAAYLYLIRPPPEAIHKPISPSKIVFAGDSAGGGLCLTTLTILRDLGLPLPAGAVLISPWVDLTHSFPSVMENYDTDIIPKYGFLAKPSTLWPNPTVPDSGGRVVPTFTNGPSLPGAADTLKPSSERLQNKREGGSDGQRVKSQQEMLESAGVKENGKHEPGVLLVDGNESVHNDELWEPKPPKVLMENANVTPLELRSQIQMYASTELLAHPLVSPVLQASLGNLPPLYIIAGNGEVLRDEVIYTAHKAANPVAFPTRLGILCDCKRQKENVEKFTTPTKVHLQVFDGMCHVLTVFMFTKSATYAYHSIGAFIKHVTQHDAEYLARNPFPESHHPHDEIADDRYLQKDGRRKGRKSKEKKALGKDEECVQVNVQENLASKTTIFQNEDIASREVEKTSEGHELEIYTSVYEQKGDPMTLCPTGSDNIEKTQVHFVRERIDIHGKVRPMEAPEDIPALKLRPAQIGLIKEAPTLRWHDGQKIWDKRYHKDTQQVMKQRAKCEAKANRLLRNAFDQGFVHDEENVNAKIAKMGLAHEDSEQGQTVEQNPSTARTSRKLRKSSSLGEIQTDRRWGPLDLYDERPPATAIAGRRDTPEAVALLRKSIYHTAPRTHKTVPRLKTINAVTAARPPKQSVSEEQVKANLIPVHGLKVWDSLLRYYWRKTSVIKTTAEKSV